MVSFLSVRDEQLAWKYIKNLLDGKRSISISNENQHFSIDLSLTIIEERMEELTKNKKDTSDWKKNELEDLLRHIRIALSGIDPDERTKVDSDGKVPSDWNPSEAFQWGIWRYETAHPLVDSDGNPLGYSPNGELQKALVPAGGGATIHVYNKIPQVIEWPLTRITQKNISFLIGKAKVSEIDAVCSVPSLPEDISSADTASRVLNHTKAQNEWQRRVDPKRILSIADFIDLPHNIIANSALLFSPPGNSSIKTSEDNLVSINFNFLKGSETRKIDHWVEDDDEDELTQDLRPMWLIDGQHRTRGLASSEIGSQMEIPIILFTDEFSLNQSAKVFAEINTLQKPLAPLHTLFMQHRFKIPQNGGKRDFQVWDKKNEETWDSRQNNLAYECAGWLASRRNGPLYDRIKFLEANQPNHTIIKANSWVDYSRYWFKTIYPPECTLHKKTIFQEIENYFTAFVNTCNHEEWPEEKEVDRNRWSPNQNYKGLLQRHSTSRVLLDIYGDVWEKASLRLLTEGSNESPISVKTFENVLKPLYWVDWRNSELIAAYHGSGEIPRSSLRIWMKAAIQHGESYAHEEVMSSKIKSKPGRGILSPPEDSRINIETETKWPSSEENSNPVILTSLRPDHSLITARWNVTDSNGRDWGPTGGYKSQAKTSEGISMHKLHWEEWMDEVDEICIKVQWSNVNRPNAIDEIILKKNPSTL